MQNYNTSQPFTVAEGEALQEKNLAEWRSVLSTEAYTRLEAEVFDATNKAKPLKSGYDVPHGQDLDEMVHKIIREFVAKLNPSRRLD